MERLIPIGDGAFRLEIDGRGEIVYVAGPADDRWAFWNGRTYRWKATKNSEERTERSDASRRRRGPSRTEVTAPMPAKIVTIAVREGDEVKTGTTLLVLEAMKMELPVAAPVDGRVRAIRCRSGDLVQGDAVLVELE